MLFSQQVISICFVYNLSKELSPVIVYINFILLSNACFFILLIHIFIALKSFILLVFGLENIPHIKPSLDVLSTNNPAAQISSLSVTITPTAGNVS
jgi:hypothetical protein